MKRLVGLAAGAALLLSTGCKGDEAFSVRKSLGVDDPQPRGVAPQQKDFPPARVEVAERVNLLGRKLVAQNASAGVEPVFITVGIKEPALFHVGAGQLWVSEGVVDRCATDAELAAVLCAELGKMVAEKRGAAAVGREIDPIPDSAHGAGPVAAGGSPYDAGHLANLAYHEKQFPRGGPDPQAVARELLKGADYSPAELDRVETLLKQSERGKAIQKQVAGPAPAPTWQK